MKKRFLHSFLFFTCAVILAACSITRRVPYDEQFLNKNSINIEGDASSIDPYELEGILKQKTNRKTAGVIRFNLRIHNLPNPVKTQRRIIRKQRKITNKNLRRMSRGKDTLLYEPTMSEWLMFTVGEPPVTLDTNLVNKSTKQLQLYMHKKGYFKATVKDSIVYGKKQKAEVIYTITPGPAYRIRNFNFSSDDKRLEGLVVKSFTDKEFDPTYIDSGNVFDIDVLDEERTRITYFLQNRGFYEFSKDFIKFDVDTTVGGHMVDVTMNISPVYFKQSTANGDTTVARNHENYKIGYLIFYLDYRAGMSTDPREDTTLKERKIVDDKGRTYLFYYHGEMNVDPQLLIKSTFLTPYTGFYKSKYVERSYRRLSSLGIYRGINIQFAHNTTYTDRKRLDCIVYLTPAQKKYFSAQASGTNKDGLFGIYGDITFTNKNAFKGGQRLTVSLGGGIEAQQTITREEETNDLEASGLSLNNTFNTIEFGPQLSLRWPKIIYFGEKRQAKISRSAMPFSYLDVGGSFQRRPDYTRNALNAGIRVTSREVKTKTHSFTIPSVTYVRIEKSAAFQARLDTTNDFLLQNSYQDLLIPTLLWYTFTYNSQQSDKIKDKRNLFFFQANGHLSGLFLDLTDRIFPNAYNKNEDGQNLIVGVPYTDFVRLDVDGRYYRTFSRGNQLAFRLAGGVGVARYGNLRVLPFERAFFGGGANGMRAYKARSLGPGSFFDPDALTNFDKIGDIQIETNIEGRFDLIGPLKLALFADIGNIWLMKPDPLRPGADFGIHFIERLAVGGGVGFRFDFDFFIIRFDFAWPLRDPALPEGEKWFFEGKEVYNTWERHPHRYPLNINLGIGLPF